MEISITQRIKSVQSLKSKSENEFALLIGSKQKTINQQLRGERSVSLDTITKIVSSFEDISPEWLLTGEGSMFKNENKIAIDKPQNTIKYFPNISGSMGGMEFLDNPSEQSIDLIIPGFSGCKYAINAYGDSMYPVIKSGQIVLLQEWKESFIDWGKIYLVVTKNGYRAIKYVYPSDEKNVITCKSENKENPPFEVSMEDILKMFLVKGWICREAI